MAQVCDEHGEWCRVLGKVEKGQEDLAKEMGEIKENLAALAEGLKERELANMKSETRAGIFYWGIRGIAIAAISILSNWLFKKLSLMALLSAMGHFFSKITGE